VTRQGQEIPQRQIVRKWYKIELYLQWRTVNLTLKFDGYLGALKLQVLENASMQNKSTKSQNV